MSELMTSINLPRDKDGFKVESGLANYGRKSRGEMIAEYRRHAEHLKVKAAELLAASETILATDDDDFIVEQYRGVHVRRNVVRIDPPSKQDIALAKARGES